MNLFIIGDVHGCYHTFREVISHWQPAEEFLVQVGDLVDRGNFVPECVELARELEAAHPGRTAFLLGNHEHEMLRYYGTPNLNKGWLFWGGQETFDQYERRPELLRDHLVWLEQRPLFWSNDHVVVSHAGFADTHEPLETDNRDGILWRRGPLLNLEGRRQIVGHTPTEGETILDITSNALYVDTGAYRGQCLTGVRLCQTGELLAEFPVPTCLIDIEPL